MSDAWRERVNEKVASQNAARALAATIVDVSEDMKWAVKSQVAQCMSDELGKALDQIQFAKEEVLAGKPKVITRAAVITWIDKLAGRLTVVRAAYRAGALPK